MGDIDVWCSATHGKDHRFSRCGGTEQDTTPSSVRLHACIVYIPESPDILYILHKKGRGWGCIVLCMTEGI